MPDHPGQLAGRRIPRARGRRGRGPGARGTGARRPLPPLPAGLGAAEELLRQALGPSDDIRYQRFTLKWQGRTGLLVYTEGLTSQEAVDAHILEPLMENRPAGDPPRTMAELGHRLVPIAGQRATADPDTVREFVYRGWAALMVDGLPGALLLAVQGWEERPVQSPPTESPMRGPRDGFVENIIHNVALVRRRLVDPALRVRYYRVGKRSQSRVALLYLADVAPERLVRELERRIQAVEYDGILDTNQLRDLLVGPGHFLFPKMESSERPDKVTAALLSGKVAVMVDNSPFVAVAPATLLDFLWAPDDYYSMPAVALMVRGARLLGWLAAMLLSPLYVAVELYNPELVRAEMALFLAQERRGIPLSAAMEVVFLELAMEMVHETTVRLPAKVGSAATVVGGLIIGQAAAEARLISGIVIIVVAISAIGSFTLPGQEIAQVWRAAKWILILASVTFGLYGMFAAIFILVSWVAAQDSFGTPYLAPVVPFIPADLAREFVHRLPWSRLRRRPRTYRAQDPDRTPAPQARKYRDGGER